MNAVIKRFCSCGNEIVATGKRGRPADRCETCRKVTRKLNEPERLRSVIEEAVKLLSEARTLVFNDDGKVVEVPGNIYVGKALQILMLALAENNNAGDGQRQSGKGND